MSDVPRGRSGSPSDLFPYMSPGMDGKPQGPRNVLLLVTGVYVSSGTSLSRPRCPCHDPDRESGVRCGSVGVRRFCRLVTAPSVVPSRVAMGESRSRGPPLSSMGRTPALRPPLAPHHVPWFGSSVSSLFPFYSVNGPCSSPGSNFDVSKSSLTSGEVPRKQSTWGVRCRPLLSFRFLFSPV